MIELFLRKRFGSGKKRVGRGIGSKKGKTCGRGTKGAKARAGYKRRWKGEGGQLPLHRKIPIRGFTRGRFLSKVLTVNVGLLEQRYEDGEVVNCASLRERGIFSQRGDLSLKVLGSGTLTKCLKIESDAVSEKAKEKILAVKGEIRTIS